MNPERDGHLVKAGGRMPYLLTASGCDDVTKVTVELDDDEAAVVRRVAERITAASEFDCMPKLKIERTTA